MLDLVYKNLFTNITNIMGQEEVKSESKVLQYFYKFFASFFKLQRRQRNI